MLGLVGSAQFLGNAHHLTIPNVASRQLVSSSYLLKVVIWIGRWYLSGQDRVSLALGKLYNLSPL